MKGFSLVDDSLLDDLLNSPDVSETESLTVVLEPMSAKMSVSLEFTSSSEFLTENDSASSEGDPFPTEFSSSTNVASVSTDVNVPFVRAFFLPSVTG